MIVIDDGDDDSDVDINDDCDDDSGADIDDNEDVSSPDGPGAQEVGGGAGGGAGVGGGAAHTGPRLGVRAVTEQEGDNRFCAVQVYCTLTCTVLCSTGVHSPQQEPPARRDWAGQVPAPSLAPHPRQLLPQTRDVVGCGGGGGRGGRLLPQTRDVGSGGGTARRPRGQQRP